MALPPERASARDPYPEIRAPLVPRPARLARRQPDGSCASAGSSASSARCRSRSATRLNETVLRRVIAVGYAMGFVAMAGAVIFEGERVGPSLRRSLAAAAFAALALVAGVRARAPAVARADAWRSTPPSCSLFLVVALGHEPAYIALLYFGWPVLTAAHFGTAWDFTRTMLLMLRSDCPSRSYFSEVSVPLLAYGGVHGGRGLLGARGARDRVPGHAAVPRARPHRFDRRPHRAAEPAGRHGRARTRRSLVPTARTPSWPSSSSTSTTSSASTTASATPRATAPCSASPRSWRTAARAPTSPRGSAARSSS